MHNHVWRVGMDPSPKKTKEELLSIIKECGEKGYWLKNEEISFSKELYSEGLINLCCENTAAVFKE